MQSIHTASCEERNRHFFAVGFFQKAGPTGTIAALAPEPGLQENGDFDADREFRQ
jgi:hypothetical protein